MLRFVKGFTLIELLVVVAIIGILSGVGIVSYNGYVWSTKKTSAKNIMQQISLSPTEYLSNNGAYFESDSSGSCDTTATLAQSNAINDHVLESEVIDPTKIGFNFCIDDTSLDTPYVSDYAVIAHAGTQPKGCKIEMLSNGTWKDDVGEAC